MRLYFAGVKASRFLLGIVPRIDVLVSYIEHWEPPADMVGSRFLDSGAYSAWSRRQPIQLSDYIDYCHHSEGKWDIIAGLDVIDDWQASKQNYLDMRREGIEIIPTFHVGDPWDGFEWLLSEWDYVALGGLVPYLSPVKGHYKRDVIRFLVKCFTLAESAGVRLHGFGMTTWRLVKMFPWASVDSTGFKAGERWGKPFSERLAVPFTTPAPLESYYKAARLGKKLGLNYSWREIYPDRNRGKSTPERYTAIMHYNIVVILHALDRLNAQRGEDCDHYRNC